MLIRRYGEQIEMPCALILGGFDGLHLGHCALLAEAKKAGYPVCITTMLGGKGGMLFTQGERERLFESAGIDFVYEIPFTDELRDTSAEAFLNVLFEKIPAKLVICGEDFRFGRGAEGTPQRLKELAHCPVSVLPLVCRDGEKIAASTCKGYLRAGQVEKLNALLAEPYFMQGIVEHGREVGRTYGFPTLNLTIREDKLSPKEGVYGGYAVTPQGQFPSIINIGARPTFDVEEKKIEAYLDGFSGDLYGETVRIYPTQYFRGIERFSTAETLKEQLMKDIKRLRETENAVPMSAMEGKI